MKTPLIGLLAALTLSASAAVATQAAAQDAPSKAVDFAGTVALSNCSGSVVRTPASKPEDPAFVLTNGHCLESGMPGAGEVIVDKPSSRKFTLLDGPGNAVGDLHATKISYGTMTDTDVGLYQLDMNYTEIENKYHVKALELNPDHPVQGTAITVVSGYWKKTYSCKIDGFVYRLKEAEWTWKDSVRYTKECKTIGGTSGSPVLDDSTGKVVAVNNTGNENGQECTLNNPCEVDESGKVTVRRGINYAQQTYLITKCVSPGNKINLNLPDCKLPKPAKRKKH